MIRFLLSLLAPAVLLPAADYQLKPTPQTVAWGYYWAAAKPALTVKSGDTVEIQTLSGTPQRLEAAGLPAGQVQPELLRLDAEVKDRGPGPHLLTGPVAIEGTQPGDVLEVRIKEVRMDTPYSYNGYGFRPGAGLLPDEFPGTRGRIVTLDRERMLGHFAPGIDIPLKPFFGSMGVAPPPAAGRIDSGPPGIHAGNLDNKELVAGTTLFIPVHAPGALFEVGDGHAAMGNGEVDLTALETSLTGVFQFIVRHDMHLTWPLGETPTHYITMGLDPDLTLATKIAVRETIDFLVREKKMSREDAYMLTSAGIDFAITQVVDGTKGVHAMIAKSLFTK